MTVNTASWRQLEGARVTARARRPAYSALIDRRTGRIVSRVNSRAAGQQGVCPGGAAVVIQCIHANIARNQIGGNRVAGSIVEHIITERIDGYRTSAELSKKAAGSRIVCNNTVAQVKLGAASGSEDEEDIVEAASEEIEVVECKSFTSVCELIDADMTNDTTMSTVRVVGARYCRLQ